MPFSASLASMVMVIVSPTFEGDGVALILSIVGPASAVSGAASARASRVRRMVCLLSGWKFQYGSCTDKRLSEFCVIVMFRRRAARVQWTASIRGSTAARSTRDFVVQARGVLHAAVLAIGIADRIGQFGRDQAEIGAHAEQGDVAQVARQFWGWAWHGRGSGIAR